MLFCSSVFCRLRFIFLKLIDDFQGQDDDYDKLLNVMVLDMRARPSNRTKTPEEIAQEEKERLEELEVFFFLNFFVDFCYS